MKLTYCLGLVVGLPCFFLMGWKKGGGPRKSFFQRTPQKSPPKKKTDLNLNTYSTSPPPKKKRYPLVNDHIAGWNITIFNWKYIFNPGPPFSVACYVSLLECRKKLILSNMVCFPIGLFFQHQKTQTNPTEKQTTHAFKNQEKEDTF